VNEAMGLEAALPDRNFPVVGIGASAGGLESLEQFFTNLPPNPGMAFVVVQHLSPDFRSMMDELLSRHSDMPVKLAEHDIEVQPNHVYLLPPGKEILIRNRRLQLNDKERPHAFTLPIDLFLRSLAKDVGPDAVAIILSGSGSDGSRGVTEIKKAGGKVFVESPDSAKFDGMPLSALATGVADRSGLASDLPRYLLQDSAEAAAEVSPEARDEAPMDTVLRLLREHLGLDFSLYKTSTVSRRVLRRVELIGASDLAVYVERLKKDPEELSALYRDLLIGVTQFFRDPEAFAYLETKVIPDLLKRVPENEEIRVWVAACATGEEAYSLAMLLHEQITAAGRSQNVKILSTDVHAASLATASTGIYQEEQLAHVSAARRERFFSKRQNGYHVSQDLRQMIVFAPHNITKDAPFTKIHLITCRNLLIYLEPEAQNTVLTFFHFGLVTGGVLFLGSSESVGTLASEFDTIDEHSKIYRKRRDVKLLDPLQIPLSRKSSGPAKMVAVQLRPGSVDPQMLGLYDQLLNQYMPPSFLINEDHDLVDSFGGAERLFRLSGRRPSMNVLDLIEGDLRTVIAGAVQRALKNHDVVRYTGVPVPDGDGWKRCVLSAQTFTNPRTRASHVLISIDDERPDGRREPAGNEAPGVGEVTASHVSDERMTTLEGELSYTRETLQSAIEELQTSNEELQSTNEELVASNEELQSTNEELHSVNEELYTVNAELQKKIVELRELNSDMQHFLESTDVAVLFLDAKLGIRKYTPSIASVFHLEPQDVGRSIRHFKHNLKRPDLQNEIERTLMDGTVVEDEVRDQEGITYFLRIFPYRHVPPLNPDGSKSRLAKIEGVVISLIDISALERVRGRLAQLSAIVEHSQDAIIGKTLDGMITTWNRGAERLYGYTAEEVVGRNIKLLAPPGMEREIDGFMESLRAGKKIESTETISIKKDSSMMDVSVTISPIYDSDGNIAGASAIARDITALKRTQRELEDREERIRLLMESTAEAIIGLGPDGRCTFVNPSCARMLRYPSAQQLVGQHVHDLVHGRSLSSDHAPENCSITGVLRTGEGAHRDDETFTRADGTNFLAEYWGYPVRRGVGIAGVVLTFLDITERKRNEDEIRAGSRRREEFLAMLSHELRNPLATVVNAAAVLQSETPPETRDRANRIIERQTRHMARLLDDLLDVSRITRGGIELHKANVDLRDVIRISIETLSPILAQRLAPVVTDLGNNPLVVYGDFDRLQQVIVNLLSNSTRYSAEDTPIHLSAFSDGDSVVVRVKDYGSGIPKDMLSHIFELFVQNRQGLERSKGGLGIGLTLVRKIVELHGGEVEAFSDGPGTGSELVVRLPRQNVPLQDDSTQEGTAAPPRRRILVVEDHDDARQMLCCLLSMQGHDVMEAADGQAAVDSIHKSNPEIVFVDIGLPVLDGYQVAQKVRSNPALDHIVLVALTGYGQQDDIETAKSAGFDEHVAKPAHPEAIDTILSQWKGRQRVERRV
jgi:two-component system CheB/CheR fusion protein